MLTHDSKTEIKRQDIFIQTIVVSYDKIYKNAFRLNRYNFERVNGIDFPFSTLITHHLCNTVCECEYEFSCLTQAPCRCYET